jgi:RNA polymerase-binding transcription factor DksA
MPSHLDGDTLPPAVIDTARGALLHELNRQRQAVIDADAVIAELAAQAVDDIGTTDEVSVAARARALAMIIEIEAALHRIDRGGYGTCESCRRWIPAARLEVIPHARTCVECSPRRIPVR